VAVANRPDKQAADYNLPWWTVDGGGVVGARGGDYALDGTVGQPDAGAMWNEASGYALAGGFWGSAVASPRAVYLPLVLRES